MAKEEFPRILVNNFKYQNAGRIPTHQNGHLDLVSVSLYTNSGLCKPLGAANNMRLLMATRTGIRTHEDAVRNELILKGFVGEELETEYNRVIDTCVTGAFDWYSYDDPINGVITDASGDEIIYLPTIDSLSEWHDKYNSLNEE